MSKDSFNTGQKDGAKFQQHVRKHPWETGAGAGPSVPKKSGDPDYTRGVKKGRDDVKRPK